MEAVLPRLSDGGVFGTFIDWRSLPTVHSAAAKLGLKPLNLIVWAKTNAGMGSLYRSQHELLPLFKKSSAPHVNNVELGRRGRWRSNLWTYPGASSLGSDARRGLKVHGRKLGRTQSVVTQTIANLERQLGLKLFDRAARKPVIVGHAESLLADAQRIVRDVHRLEARARSLVNLKRHRLVCKRLQTMRRFGNTAIDWGGQSRP
jgi:hypothetical protein